MTDTQDLMTLAAAASRRALYAALQRALIVITNDSFGGEMFREKTFSDKLTYVRAGLEIGAELGSPEQIAAGR